MKRREKLTSIIILDVGLTGLILFLFSKPPLLPPITMLLAWSSVACRILRQYKLFGAILILLALTILFNTSQTPFLFFAVGAFLNGLVIMVNKGMPVQGQEFVNGIHIPMQWTA